MSPHESIDTGTSPQFNGAQQHYQVRDHTTNQCSHGSAPRRCAAHGATLSCAEFWSGVPRLATITALMACRRFSA
jgi:hypothetical protein